MLAVSLLGVGTVRRLERGARPADGQMTKGKQRTSTPPPPLGAGNACLVGENPTCSVLTL